MLSGMNAESQLQENMKTLSDEHVADLTQEEKDLIDRVFRRIQPPDQILLHRLATTACRVRKSWTSRGSCATTTGTYTSRIHRRSWNTQAWIPAGRHASDCIGCKACEEKCPQHLPISQAMKEAAEAMAYSLLPLQRERICDAAPHTKITIHTHSFIDRKEPQGRYLSSGPRLFSV